LIVLVVVAFIVLTLINNGVKSVEPRGIVGIALRGSETDLFINDISLSSEAPKQNDVVSVNVMVNNRGEKEAGYIATIDFGDSYSESTQKAPLPKGATDILTFTHVYTEKGSYNIQFYIVSNGVKYDQDTKPISVQKQPMHLECRNSVCMQVNGPGKNQCIYDSDCFSSSSSENGYQQSTTSSSSSSSGSVGSGTENQIITSGDIAISDIVFMPPEFTSSTDVTVSVELKNTGTAAIDAIGFLKLYYDDEEEALEDVQIVLKPGYTQSVFMDTEVFRTGVHAVKATLTMYKFDDIYMTNNVRAENMVVI
jgi:hypothetical protein